VNTTTARHRVTFRASGRVLSTVPVDAVRTAIKR
jgi:hypothetical protein